ncbi:MAG: hypothetical protein H0W11_09340 [Gemmatimonadetes bacterium]|jgi:hypothetical protein|nr:hypothetical protein [Gemmatimonadota bacterium]
MAWGFAAALLLVPAPLVAQTASQVGGRNEVFVGSELESYLRFLQSEGRSELYPWSVRSFSAAEVERLLPRDSAHPWAGRYDLQPDTTGGFRLELIRPQAQLIFNSAFPYGANNGAVWAGRGLTTALHAGVSARYGAISLTLAPVVFRAENASFELAPTGREGRLAYADGGMTDFIDLPQRFGDEPYLRIDPGQSNLRLDLPVVAAGISTANQHWGPASEHPILLGNNAPGFLHAFLGSSAPLDVWLGRVHGRLVWGRLEQSDYSPVEGAGSQRFMSGLVGVFQPRGVSGLELGAARFFHEPWPEEGIGLDNLLKPIEGFWKGGLRDSGVLPGEPKTSEDNQLASVFFRWVFRRSGAEVYGEYGREDHSWNRRDFLVEPDHSGGYMLGLRKRWRRSEQELVTVRGELLNLQISHIVQVRQQGPFYVHGWTRQGHTHRGQILGSAAGYGGAGSILAADYYYPRGRWSVAWTRTVRQDRERPSGVGDIDRRGLDVLHSLGIESLFFLGRFDITAGLTGVYNFNRNFGSDAFNLNSVLSVRGGI